MTKYPHIAHRVFNTPLAISRAKAEVIIAAMREQFDIHGLFDVNGNALAIAPAPKTSQQRRRASMGPIDDYHSTLNPETTPDYMYPAEVIDGVMVISVVGVLVNKHGTLRPYCGMMGYDGIRANISLGLEDESVKAIVLDIDSPGGEVAGCFDLVDTIYAARGQKPIVAILSENAYSAAYAIASAADSIAVPRTGGTGSVGVICMHTDYSKAMADMGINITLIQFGARKAEGNEFKPLSDEALKQFQADVDAMGELFVETVARNRKLPPAQVRATQAATFLGAEGIRVGFADAVLAPDEAFSALLTVLR